MSSDVKIDIDTINRLLSEEGWFIDDNVKGYYLRPPAVDARNSYVTQWTHIVLYIPVSWVENEKQNIPSWYAKEFDEPISPHGDMKNRKTGDDYDDVDR